MQWCGAAGWDLILPSHLECNQHNNDLEHNFVKYPCIIVPPGVNTPGQIPVDTGYFPEIRNEYLQIVSALHNQSVSSSPVSKAALEGEHTGEAVYNDVK